MTGPSWLTPSRLDLLLLEANWAGLQRQLARGMAHEVRGPLQGLLLAGRELDPRGSSDDLELILTTVRSASSRFQALAEWLGNLAKPLHPVTIGPIAVAELLPRVIALARLYRETRRVEMPVEVSSGLPAARGSIPALEHALLNLLVNARDAIAAREDGGVGGSIRIDAARSGDDVEIAVTDNGPGVPESLGERIFEPFCTTKGGSRLGLGLPVARLLTTLCEGDLVCDFAAPTGARFVVRLRPWGWED